MKFDAAPVGITAVIEGLDEAFVRFVEFDVFSDEGDVHLAGGIPDDVDDVLPGLHVGLARPDVEELADFAIDVLPVEITRHHVDAFDIAGAEDAVLADVAEKGEFPADVTGEIELAAADEDVGLDANFAEGGDAVLGWLGLEFVGGADVGHKRDVDVDDVAAILFSSELSDSLEERQRFDVADGAADLDDGDVTILRRLKERQLNFVGDMRNDLDGRAQIIAATFLGDDAVIDAPGRAVVGLARVGMGEPFIMPQIHVRLRPVFGHVDLAVLKGIHRPRIDVDIGIEFEKIDAQTARLQQRTDGGRADALAKRTDDAASDEDVFCRTSHDYPYCDMTRPYGAKSSRLLARKSRFFDNNDIFHISLW